MIRYLRGTVFLKQRNQLILDVNGVGYNLSVLPSLLTQALPGEALEVHVTESIREDAHDLYGFLSLTERDAFEVLRKVSGIGPKAALGLLSAYAPHTLATIIEQEDATQLSLVPGVGKKMASKIIVELKGKLEHGTEGNSHDTDNTVAALQALGYGRSEIAALLPKIPASLRDTSERVTWVLRHIGE